jgi:transketolase
MFNIHKQNMKQINETALIKAATALRILAASAVEKVKSGHPGMPLGFADVFVVLIAEFLKFNPDDARWFGRDRLVLSAGHGSMLLYVFYYLAGYKDFTIEDIKSFRQLHSKTPGHPEYGVYDAIETTTGPLGQGFANSVGMAIAAKKYAAETLSQIADHKVYCIAGDGCLMEGISYEAASIAGHLKLNNLIVLFDDNNITIDGNTDLTVSENHLLKFQSLGWNTIAIDGHNFTNIRNALSAAQNSDKPFFIACKTTIGYGSSKANSCQSHGAPLGAKAFEELKQFFNWPHEDFVIPDEILAIWRGFSAKSEVDYEKWHEDFNQLTIEQQNYLNPFKFKQETIAKIKAIALEDAEASRISSSKIIDVIIQNENKVLLGSADLSSSVGLMHKHCHAITRDDFSGNFIHYGTREHAMAAIMNGLSLEGFLPIGGTFLVFSDYMRPGIRLSSLMSLGVIYIMTHDSIGLGEDGPTHQPVEHLSSLRSIANLNVFRPADATETIGAFEFACLNLNRPSLIVLSRQVLQNTQLTSSNLVSKGAYFLSNEADADVTIFATGSEIGLAKNVADLLKSNNIKINLVSVVCFNLFFEQDADYINTIIGNSKIKVAIEAASSYGWHRFIGDGLFFGVETFGMSAPYQDLYNHFGLTAENIFRQIMKKYENRN